MKQHTFGADGVTALELLPNDLPPEFVERLFNAAVWLLCLVNATQIQPAEADDEADGAINELTSLVDEAWRLHSKPTSVDLALARSRRNERLALVAKEAP